MSTGFIDTLESRGFIKQCTDLDALREHCDKGPVSAYIGYDPTASSLHVGNLLTIITMMHLERAGHRPVALIGGGTRAVILQGRRRCVSFSVKNKLTKIN